MYAYLCMYIYIYICTYMKIYSLFAYQVPSLSSLAMIFASLAIKRTYRAVVVVSSEPLYWNHGSLTIELGLPH